MQHYERGNHSPAGITRLNQCIDIAALGGNGGVGERFSGIGGTHRRPLGSGQHVATLRRIYVEGSPDAKFLGKGF